MFDNKTLREVTDFWQRFSSSISPKLFPTFSPVFSPTFSPTFSPNCLPEFLSYFVSHYSFAPYCQYSQIISGQSLDSTDSRGVPLSCTICRRLYLGPWCPCRAWRSPCPTRRRPVWKEGEY